MTKIIRNDNKFDFLPQLALLHNDEQPLLCFKQDELNWLLLTSDRVIEEREGTTLFISYSVLLEVSMALHEEHKDGVMNMADFTRLILKDTHGKSHIIKLEKGEPYIGIFQMLHYIA